jgi:hypothetical protein
VGGNRPGVNYATPVVRPRKVTGSPTGPRVGAPYRARFAHTGSASGAGSLAAVPDEERDVHRDPAPRRLAPALLLGVLALGACGGDSGDADDSVVAIDVPDNWQRSDPEVTAEVVESLRWTPPGDDGSSLQVVVGCGTETTAEELLEGAARGERPMPVVGAADEPEPVEVDGLEDALRVTFAMGASQDDVRAWQVGLYGVTETALVLVELFRPHAQFSESQAAEILDSVSVDAEAAAERCTEDEG